MERIAVYPGSFDPVTLGHMDIIRRAAKLYDRLIVCILYNPAKKGCFPVDIRKKLLQDCCRDLPNVVVDSAEGLTVSYALNHGACAMIRGLRTSADFLAEQELAQLNARLAPSLETMLLMTQPRHQCVSSSAVRQLLLFHQPLSGFVPDEICSQVESLYHELYTE